MSDKLTGDNDTAFLDCERMHLNSGTAILQVLTATQALAHPLDLQTPTLITHIETNTVLQNIVAKLQAQFPSHHPLTILPNGSGGEPIHTSLALLSQPSSIQCPIYLYLPPPPSALTIALQGLVNVVAQLRNPEGGCPWDLAQTPQTLTPYIIEEAYETVDAIQAGDPQAIAEELGDLLLQVVLQAQIASEQQAFTLQQVAEGITSKLIRRHPHVFGNVQVSSVEEVHTNWEQIKAAEKGQTSETTDRLSHKLQRDARRLPPLMAGMKLSEKAAASGLEWETIDGVWAKFYEELAEFQEALLRGDPGQQQAELGDLMFTLINIARWCRLDPSDALRQTNQKLIERVSAIEASTSKPLVEHTLEELEALWQEAKQKLNQVPSENSETQVDVHSNGLANENEGQG